MEKEAKLFNKGAWKGILIALVFVIAVQLILAWQYYRLEEKRLPQLEQQILEQQEQIEKRGAQDVLRSFLDARALGDEVKAMRYLTENAVEQKEKGELILVGEFDDYAILQTERKDENTFRFQAEKRSQQGFPSQVEIIQVLKILDSYYIHSVEIAG